jgi:hypothetical protein
MSTLCDPYDPLISSWVQEKRRGRPLEQILLSCQEYYSVTSLRRMGEWMYGSAYS